MKTFRLYKTLLASAAFCAFAAGASAQDIKLGYNGDLSASPSAQSGQAASSRWSRATTCRRRPSRSRT